MEHFVSALAIDLKLATYMRLDKVTLHTKFQPDSINDSATRGPQVKTRKVP